MASTASFHHQQKMSKKEKYMKETASQEVGLDLNDIFEGIREDLNIEIDTSTGNPIPVRTTDYGTNLVKLDKAVRDMVASKEPFYEPGVGKTGKVIFKKTKLSKHFDVMNVARGMYKPGCLYSEYLMLFFDTVHKLGMWDERFTAPDAKSSLVPEKKQAERCIELLEMLQKEGKTKEFKKRVSSRQEKAASNFKSAMTYENEVFVWRSRILVMRIDFGYLAEYGKVVTLEEAKRDLKHFLNNRRKNATIFGPMGGYIAKLEYGGDGKGYHFHVVFFFDGAKAIKDTYKVDQMGQYWVNTVTKGKGYYHNCNRDKRKYKYLGIGMVHRDDVEKRGNLSKAIEYLTKKDLCFKLDMAEGRLFFKGGKPPNNLTGVGRPPKKSTEGDAKGIVQTHAISVGLHGGRQLERGD